MSPINHKIAREFGSLELLAKQVVEGFITGLHKSPFHGFSVEFAEHRLYNKGESTRHIDWKLYARTEKLFVKRYEEETNLRCRIIIDDSSSMYYGEGDQNKLRFAVNAAAAMIYLMRKQRDAVGLSVFDEKLDTITPIKSSQSHIHFLFDLLEKYLESSETRGKQTMIPENLHSIAEQTHKRSLVVLFSDLFDSRNNMEELFNALKHLKHNKHEVIVFDVKNKKLEIDFDFENRPTTFVDMETGEQIKLNPVQVREKYQNSIRDFQHDVKLRCAQFQIDYLEADVNQGFNEILLQYLIKRQKIV